MRTVLHRLLAELRELIEDEIPFSVGDEVLYGKYKNKRGKLVAFGRNPKGQVTVEIEPIPKGRKSNKTMGLFKIWALPSEEAAPRRVRRRLAGKGTRRLTKKCPTGMRIQGGRCVRVPSSVRAKQRRQKKKWRKSGAGRKSAKRSARFRKKFDWVEHLIQEGRRLLAEG